jgi:hypothetical protein
MNDTGMATYCVGLILAASTAVAGSLPVTSIPAEATPYVTEQAAVVAALSSCATISVQVEYGGFIVRRGLKFYYSTPVTNHISNEVDYTIAFSKSDTLIALYHTHPASPDVPDEHSEVFSGADITAAKSVGLHSYIGVFKDHTVREYVPGDQVGHGHMAGTDAPFAYAFGHVTGGF